MVCSNTRVVWHQQSGRVYWGSPGVWWQLLQLLWGCRHHPTWHLGQFPQQAVLAGAAQALLTAGGRLCLVQACSFQGPAPSQSTQQAPHRPAALSQDSGRSCEAHAHLREACCTPHT